MQDCDKQRESMQALLEKVIIKQFHENLYKEVTRLNLVQYKISELAGKGTKGFNKMVTEMRNVKLSNLLRYHYAINALLKKGNIDHRIKLDDLITEELNLTIEFAEKATYADIESFINENNKFFYSIMFHLDHFNKRNDLNDSEKELLDVIKSMLKNAR